MGDSVGFLIAFSAGLLSFLSPCVLPLVPSYISFISGMSLEEASGRRWVALSHAIFFIVGFTIIFMLLGASATALGRMLNYYQVWLERIGGLLIIVFGLYLMGVFKIGAFARERRFHISDKPTGYLGSLLIGIAFGAGWTPCIGPILGAILTYAGTQGRVAEGVFLLGAYSMGLAVPFLVAAFAIDHFLEWFKKYSRFLPLASRIAGGAMVLVGLLLVTGYFSILAGWLQAMTPEFIRSRI